MKALRKTLPVVLCLFLLVNITSCLVVHESDNGKHREWYKNPHNPHHPNSTNPGKAKGKSKGKNHK